MVFINVTNSDKKKIASESQTGCTVVVWQGKDERSSVFTRIVSSLGRNEAHNFLFKSPVQTGNYQNLLSEFSKFKKMRPLWFSAYLENFESS